MPSWSPVHPSVASDGGTRLVRGRARLASLPGIGVVNGDAGERADLVHERDAVQVVDRRDAAFAHPHVGTGLG
jgi:hypothetical protein